VAGQVVEVNTAVPDKLETLSTDPYNAGWIIKVRLADEAALSKLLNYSAYQKQCAAES
jgi:glycine cleavage system H protein